MVLKGEDTEVKVVVGGEMRMIRRSGGQKVTRHRKVG